MDNNAQKTFAFVFPLGGKLEWSGDTVVVLIDRASPGEREGLRNWIERCKPGWFYRIQADNGMAICTGYDEQAKPLQHFADEGHGYTEKSKAAFLKYRNQIGPVQEVKVSWDENAINTAAVVIGKNGNHLTLSGFAVGFSGEGFRGMCWLLDMCGVFYDKEVVRSIDVNETREVSFQSMYQTSNGIQLQYFGNDPSDRIWDATVLVDRANGETIKVKYPEADAKTENLFNDLSELIDIIIGDMELRGVTWAADPYLTNMLVHRSESQMAEFNKIIEKESTRVGWNFHKMH